LFSINNALGDDHYFTDESAGSSSAVIAVALFAVNAADINPVFNKNLLPSIFHPGVSCVISPLLMVRLRDSGCSHHNILLEWRQRQRHELAPLNLQAR
jgi:hypothetical protein